MFVRNALTIDVEEWYQTVLFKDSIRGKNVSTNLTHNIGRILSILEEYDTKATFFIVADVADKNPSFVKSILNSGHEIASHGYKHKLVYKYTHDEFRGDVERSFDILSNLSGTAILGYRACTWSTTNKMTWALDILKETGFRYDASIYPIALNPLTVRELRRYPHILSNGLIEFPPSVFTFWGYNFPFAGGTFLRFFPKEFIKHKINQINSLNKPAIVYLHSWEFDVYPEHLRQISFWKKFIQYANLDSVEQKLRFLLESFKFTTISEILRYDEYIVDSA